jgi:basic membrane protein A
MFKKSIALLVVMMLLVGLMAGCGQKAPEQPAPAAPAEEEKIEMTVGFVTDIGGIDDRSFNQGTYEGIKKYADEKGLTEGQEYKYIQSNEEADYIPNLSAFGDETYDLVIAAGFLFENAMKEVAPQYLDTNFAIIDTVIDSPNVASVVFAEEQGSFLVGVAAAKATKTKKVGFVGGMDFPLIRKFHAGFVAGVHAVDKSIQVVDQYAGDFGNPGAGQQIASTMYAQGVDVIYHAAGGTGNGVINEAKNRVENGEAVWVIGVDKDQYEDGKMADGKSVVLTSMMKRVDVAAYSMMEAQEKGQFPGGTTTTLDLKVDGVGIPAENPNLAADIVTEINSFKDKIVGGEIVVPTTMEELETFEASL